MRVLGEPERSGRRDYYDDGSAGDTAKLKVRRRACDDNNLGGNDGAGDSLSDFSDNKF